MTTSSCRITSIYSLLAATLVLAACGGGGGGGGGSSNGSPHTVGGTVSGLTGSGLVLADNGGDSLTITASGNFTFATSVAGGASYNVTVATQPTNPTQSCTVAHGSGTISGSDVTNVAITCTTSTFTIGGTISGLSGSGLALALNGTNNPAISSAGAFTLTPAVASGSTYSVTVATQPTSPAQTCTIATGGGTVQAANVTNVAVTCTSNTYGVGAYVSGLAGAGLALSFNRGAALAVSRNGLFNAATGVAQGANYTVSIASQPTNPAQTCVLTGGSGTIGSSDVTSVSVFCPQSVGRFVYVAGQGDVPLALKTATPGNISVFSIDPTTGALTAVAGSTVPGGPQVFSLQFVPHSNFLWGLNLGNEGTNDLDYYRGSIYDYSVDPNTGLLTAVTGSPTQALDGTSTTPGCNVPGYGTTTSFTFSPSGGFGYVTNDGVDASLNVGISEFTLDPTSGLPTLVPGSQLPQCMVAPVTIDPSGQFAYTGVNATPGIYAFNINATTGALMLAPGGTASGGPHPVIPDPAGHFAYQASDSINAYQIDPDTGALTAISGSPFSTGVVSIVIEPRGKFAYGVIAGFNVVTYSIDGTTGALTQVSADMPPTLTAQGAPTLTIDPSGQFLFAIAQNGSGQTGVFVYSIDASTGALTAVPGSPFGLVNSYTVGAPTAVSIMN
jgi:6-phosphogluconolactonase (cycloisomerase 2 family)